MVTLPGEMRVIRTPRELHGVESAAAYRARARRWLVDAHKSPELRETGERRPAYVHYSTWVVECPCGQEISASAEWRTAICLVCGAVVEPLFPLNQLAIEATLLQRPDARTRNWLPTAELMARFDLRAIDGTVRGETLADLVAENLQHAAGAN